VKHLIEVNGAEAGTVYVWGVLAKATTDGGREAYAVLQPSTQRNQMAKYQTSPIADKPKRIRELMKSESDSTFGRMMMIIQLFDG
jgi:hypothetical protein